MRLGGDTTPRNTTMTPKEIMEERAEVAKTIYQLRDKSNDAEHQWTPEDESSWKKANDDYNDLSQKLERAQTAEKIESEQNERQEAFDRVVRPNKNANGRRDGAPSPAEDQALALQAWLMVGQDKPLKDEHRDACERLGVNPHAREFEIAPSPTRNYDDVKHRAAAKNRELRTTNYTSTVDTQGGDVVPPGDLYSTIETAMLAYGGVRGVATVIQTSAGAPLMIPTNNDTTNTGELVGEVADSGDSAVADANVTTGNVELNAYLYSSKLVRVSASLLQDSAFDLASFIGDLLGTRLGRIQNTHFTTGSGGTQPNGIVTAASSGKTAASATTITADEIIDLLHSVDPSYRPGARFMGNDAVWAAIRKLKDSDGQYLWQSGLRLGMPDTLLGFATVVNQQMAGTMAANAKVLLFGDMSKYFIRDAGGIRLRRLVERYAEYDQEGFVAFRRSDGDLVDAGTNPVKYLAMAAS